MKNRAIYIIIVVVVILVIGFLFYGRNKQAQAPTLNDQAGQVASNTNVSSNSSNTATNVNSSTNAVTPAPAINSGTHFSNESDVTGQNKVVEVDYNDTSFSPATVNIKVGDTVVFKNKSSGDFWPASNPHPIHTDYLGFNAGAPLGPGQIYQFIFAKVGSWGYHNHLNPSSGGTIVVSQ